ncbi:MAG: preprotein translocase subunit SecA [Candidatus Improbicoccus pseudotrichonymphae]|uniref:Protein translocase subunit SecA n=1 Tax=Candidatus Improbicoccus pseudotrichonymphae TaxID=3033792 RepID=A0AA48HY65_9FIRM|nr:MAG: preprotein translocase subunit SecA [Candidatus Improbicoccus pseudotrichonymphae]
MDLLKIFFGNYSKRELRRIDPIVKNVLNLEQKYLNMSDEELVSQTGVLKNKIEGGIKLDEILPDAFAVCREASDRILGMRHYPVQIIAGIALHQGRIAEMRTGEGKTLMATLPAYLNALTGLGVHIVTVNDYLAKRDANVMGKVYGFLNLKTGLINHDMNKSARKNSYDCDITYATNNELGFDYLRDNMVSKKEYRVQRGQNFAIIDEVDSILIDEARTPLIISGEGDKSTELYSVVDKFVRGLRAITVTEINAKEDNDEEFSDYDYVIDEKAKTATLTPKGVEKSEVYFKLQSLTDPENITLQHHINQAIKAHGTMKRDIDYVVQNGKVMIVDEFTGRIMHGRRYNEGLHQALEAKESVNVEKESKTLASITFQNYFRLYSKLSGMTGTGITEEDEFREIYKLDTIAIPPNKPVVRKDMPDVIYKTERGKFSAIIKEIEEANAKGQPVLVGTSSIEKSEILSSLLKSKGIKHEVLNAKYHEKEAEIIAQAGQKSAITIATNMAGRGTDIILGGNAEYKAKAELRRTGMSPEMILEACDVSLTDDQEIINARLLYTKLLREYKEELKKFGDEVREAGGLYIIGTERHESRRIDNQLRGRSGRQGDPGQSKFFLSLEDDLMRIFGGERLNRIMTRFNYDEDTPLEAGILSRIIESAQKKVEMRNFASRKSVLQFDDVLNRQREIVYSQRNQVLDGADIHNQIQKIIASTVRKVVGRYLLLADDKKNWNLEGLRDYYVGWVLNENDLKFDEEELSKQTIQNITDIITEKSLMYYAEQEKLLGEDKLKENERRILIGSVDKNWMDHMDNMEELKRGINLRAYAQRDPVVDYRLEGFDMFDEMIDSIKEEVVKSLLLFRLKITQDAFEGFQTFLDCVRNVRNKNLSNNTDV